MELNDLFKNGKYKGRTLLDVWQGEYINLSFKYVQELTDLILRNGNKHDKIYSPIFDLDLIENDFKIVFENHKLIKITCTNEYIIIESISSGLIDKTKNILKTILNANFKPHNNGFFQRSYMDIRHELPCDLLKIDEISMLNNEEFLLKCSQNILGKRHVAFKIVNLEFCLQNNLWDIIKSLSMENRTIKSTINFPIEDNKAYNIELEKSIDNNHPLGRGLKLNPLLSDENGEVILSKEGKTVYLKNYIVHGKAFHKLDIDEYPKYEAGISEGSKDLLRMMGDPSYIEYCMNNWEDFYIAYDDFNDLINDHVPHIIEFELTELDYNILKYKAKFVEIEYKFRETSIDENERKYSLVDDEEDYFEELSYDEFNGIYGFDDDTINDAFEGDPSNYWNID